jgi:hypothetical protein
MVSLAAIEEEGKKFKESPFRGTSESSRLAKVQHSQIRASHMWIKKNNCCAIDLVVAGAAGNGPTHSIPKLDNLDS